MLAGGGGIDVYRFSLGDGVDHDELLVHLVGGDRQRARVADGVVVLRRLLEQLQLRVSAGRK